MLRAWIATVDTAGLSCVASEGELVAFVGGRERRVGTFPFAG
jgi:LDH2 family malate/lactate/ureidoglycolate dehydrogenase